MYQALEPKSRELNIKPIKDMLIKAECSNNYSTYSPSQDRVISNRDVIIKKILT